MHVCKFRCCQFNHGGPSLGSLTEQVRILTEEVFSLWGIISSFPSLNIQYSDPVESYPATPVQCAQDDKSFQNVIQPPLCSELFSDTPAPNVVSATKKSKQKKWPTSKVLASDPIAQLAGLADLSLSPNYPYLPNHQNGQVDYDAWCMGFPNYSNKWMRYDCSKWW